MFSRNGSLSRPALDTWCPADARHCGHPAPCPRSLAEDHVGSRNPRQCRCSIVPPGAAGPCYWQWCTGKWIPLDWWVGTLTPPFHKNLIYVMVGYRYICIEWILFWAYMLWNTTIVLPSRPDMQKNTSPLCYGNCKTMKSWNQEKLIYILWNGLHLEGVILRYLKIF